MSYHRFSQEEFDARVLARVSPESSDECWPISGNTSNGYAMIGRKGVKVGVHRELCRIYHGEPAPGQVTKHSCDRKTCGNPAHISWGSQKENVQEARDRNLMQGSTAKITRAQANVIRESASSTRELSESYGIHPVNIRAIRNGLQWKTG